MKPILYLASGWFNPEQKKQMDEIYEVLCLLRDEGKLKFFSPFYNGIVLKMGDPEFKQKMKEVWELDIQKVVEADLIVAGTQDHDVGTIFECGYGSAMGTKILCYNSKQEYGLNLMLAQEARGFIKNPADLKAALESYVQAFEAGKQDDWTWNEWKGETI